MGNNRFGKESVLINAFILFCSGNNIPFIRSGLESKEMENNFVEIIRENKNAYNQIIRYFPDFIVYINNTMWLVECKNSLAIEKDAYDVYCQLSQQGYNVVVVFSKDNEIQITPLSEIKLKAPNWYDNTPIEGIWAYPRKLINGDEKTEYLKWKERHPNASGTAMSAFDFDNMIYHKLTLDNFTKLLSFTGNLWDIA